MIQIKMFPDKFTNDRRLSWLRSRCQARYRGEDWQLTFEEYCVFWKTQARYYSRGKESHQLVLTRFDPEDAWDRDNCCIIDRKTQTTIALKRRHNKEVDYLYKGAIWYGQ